MRSIATEWQKIFTMYKTKRNLNPYLMNFLSKKKKNYLKKKRQKNKQAFHRKKKHFNTLINS